MARPIQVLFGTETGTAEMCASDLVDALKSGGWAAKLVDMDHYDENQLPGEHLVVVITSTFGNGDPPANAENLLEHLRNDRPQLGGMPFAVMALGDSVYPCFAQCGKDFDALLGELGGRRIIDRVDCDGHVDVPFADFQKALLDHLEANPEAFPKGGDDGEGSGGGLIGKMKSWLGWGKKEEKAPAPTTRPSPAPTKIDRNNPAVGSLVEAVVLSGEGSTKDTRHYVVDVGDGHGLRPGDSIGIYATNNPTHVSAVISAAGLDASTTVNTKTGEATLSEALASACLHKVTPKLMRACGGDAAAAADAGGEVMQSYIEGNRVLDVVGGDIDAQTLVDTLNPLTARLYSVANRVSDSKVDLCVETTRYTFNGREVEGVASTWLADRVAVGGSIRWYPHVNGAFHLPEGEAPLIMVGPGTGVAPFRGFLQELAHDGAGRRTWLFFGHRNAAVDNLYGEEVAKHLDSGVLTKLTHAWSRDQDERIYVQHRIAEHGDEVWQWLSDGGIVMVCGDASGMAPGVREAFKTLATSKGEDGETWLDRAVADGRYREDVY